MDENREWKRLHNEELRSLHRLPNIITVIKCRILKWASHVARLEEDRNALKTVTGKPIGNIPLGRLGVDNRIILEWILKK